jgi:translocation and assembly module TamB
VKSPQLFGQMQLSGVDIDGNFMPFDMQPSQLAMNFNGTRSTLQGR